MKTIFLTSELNKISDLNAEIEQYEAKGYLVISFKIVSGQVVDKWNTQLQKIVVMIQRNG